jgi:hypothetical protein
VKELQYGRNGLIHQWELLRITTCFSSTSGGVALHAPHKVLRLSLYQRPPAFPSTYATLESLYTLPVEIKFANHSDPQNKCTLRGFGWHIHCGGEVTELSTNNQHISHCHGGDSYPS